MAKQAHFAEDVRNAPQICCIGRDGCVIASAPTRNPPNMTLLGLDRDGRRSSGGTDGRMQGAQRLSLLVLPARLNSGPFAGSPCRKQRLGLGSIAGTCSANRAATEPNPHNDRACLSGASSGDGQCSCRSSLSGDDGRLASLALVRNRIVGVRVCCALPQAMSIIVPDLCSDRLADASVVGQ